MAAYAVFIRESTRDAAELATYSQKVGRTLAGHPVEVLAAYGRQEVLEGPEVEGVVILRFPSLEAAKDNSISKAIVCPGTCAARAI